MNSHFSENLKIEIVVKQERVSLEATCEKLLFICSVCKSVKRCLYEVKG